MTDPDKQHDQPGGMASKSDGTGFDSALRKMLLFFIVMMFPVIIGLVFLNVQQSVGETTEQERGLTEQAQIDGKPSTTEEASSASAAED